jgi:hypothetical protein
MFISNLHNAILGIDGRLNLAVGEVNHYIDDSDTDLVARIKQLESAKLVSVSTEQGLVKTGITGRVVKAIGVDTAAVSNSPRSGFRTTPARIKDDSVAPEASSSKTVKTRKTTKTAVSDAVETE